MAVSMADAKVDMDKVMILPKGIDLMKFGKTKPPPNQKNYALLLRVPYYRNTVTM